MASSRRNAYRGNREGLVDVWNAFMLIGATYDNNDIPVCPCTASQMPHRVISWTEARRIHRQEMRRGNKDYRVGAFIHFYIDDLKFDGPRAGVWQDPFGALEIIEHFEGIITPDYSTCQDFPEPVKLFAVYRMRAFGFWIGSQGISVINNVRWGTEETWGYCFSGIPAGGIVAVGVSGSGLKLLKNRPLFVNGFRAMIEKIDPSGVLLYGSLRGVIDVDEFSRRGIKFAFFESETAAAYRERRSHE